VLSSLTIPAKGEQGFIHNIMKNQVALCIELEKKRGGDRPSVYINANTVKSLNIS